MENTTDIKQETTPGAAFTVNLDRIRDDFPMISAGRGADVSAGGRPVIYLDSGASSQTPRQVIAAMDEFYNEYRANIHRGMYGASEEATARYEDARVIIATFFGATSDEIIFTRGTTESLNLLAYTLTKKLGPGDEVVISIMEHHANLVPWQQKAKEQGFDLKFIPLKKDFTLDMAEAARLITPKTKIVSVTYASNVLGTVNLMKELAALAHNVGALFVVDAAQMAGHRAINVRELDCDFFACSGHKMLGPTGIGILYGRKKLLDVMDPFMYGGDMINEVRKEYATWNEVPFKFEAGTPNIAGAIGLDAAVAYLEAIGLEKIHEHEIEITNYALQELSKISGLTIYGPPTEADRVGVISFVINGMHPHDVATLLDRDGVAVRGGHHCAMPLLRELNLLNGIMRASFHIYTTKEDIDGLVAAINKAKAIFKL